MISARSLLKLFVFLTALGAPARAVAQRHTDRISVIAAALDTVRNRHPAGPTALVPSAERALDVAVARRIGFSSDTTNGDRFVAVLSVLESSLTGDTASVLVSVRMRVESGGVYFETATMKLARHGERWRVILVRREEIS